MYNLSLTKEARIYNGEKTISLTSGAGKTGQPLGKECNEHFLTPHTKINSKSKHKTRNYKTPRGNHKQNTIRHKSQQDPL